MAAGAPYSISNCVRVGVFYEVGAAGLEGYRIHKSDPEEADNTIPVSQYKLRMRFESGYRFKGARSRFKIHGRISHTSILKIFLDFETHSAVKTSLNLNTHAEWEAVKRFSNLRPTRV